MTAKRKIICRLQSKMEIFNFIFQLCEMCSSTLNCLFLSFYLVLRKNTKTVPLKMHAAQFRYYYERKSGEERKYFYSLFYGMQRIIIDH